MFRSEAVTALLAAVIVCLSIGDTRARVPPPALAGRVDVPTFAGNAQHTAIYEPAAADLNTILWSATIDFNQATGLAHYGSPLVTAANTVLISVKTATDSFFVTARDGRNGTSRYANLTSDYIAPTHNWYPVFNPALAAARDSRGDTITRLYYPGAGGTVFAVDNPDSASHGAPVRIAFYGTGAYTANPTTFNDTVFINTPITADSQGNIFFGFRVQGTAPAPLSTTQSGFARITPDGIGTFVLAGTAAADTNIARDSHNSAPALSLDETTVYVVVRSATTTSYGYLLGLNTTTLQTKYRVFLRDPRNNHQNNAVISDDSTASPTVAPDGDVYFGVLGNPGNGSRGFLLRFSSDLVTEKIPGAFGWDSTAAIVPSTMVPSYGGTSPYLIFAKYNNYAGTDGDGVNRIALLDPDSVQVDPHTSANSLIEMREVMTVIGPTPEASRTAAFPNAVREWCINTAAVNPATRSVFVPNEDGYLYRWDLATNSLAQGAPLTRGFGEPYVPTIIGPDGTIFTLNGGTLFAVGNPATTSVIVESSRPDTRDVVAGESLTFTARVSGSENRGTVTFRDVYYPDTSVVALTRDLGRATLTNGVAAVTSTNVPAGAHFITATHDDTGVSATRVQKVHASGTVTALIAANQPTSGRVSLTAIVAALGSGSPTGMMTFRDGTRVLGQAPIAGGSATIESTSLATGTHSVSATYASDVFFAASQTTITYPDNSPPSQPTGLSAASGPNARQVTLTWNANPAAETVATYEIWRTPWLPTSSSLLAITPLTTFVDTLARSGTSAGYYIVAIDSGGNRSPASVMVQARSK